MGPLAGALISGGASLLGGLLKGKGGGRASAIAKGNIKRVTQANTREVQWNKKVQARADAVVAHYEKAPIFEAKRFHAEAEKAGFNPVTFLNAVGNMYSGNRNSGIAMQGALVGLDKPAYQAYEDPRVAIAEQNDPGGQSFGDHLGNAVVAGANSYMAIQQQVDQNNFAREQLMTQLVHDQNMQNQRIAASHRFGLGGGPTMRSTESVVSNGELTIGKGGGVGSLTSLLTAAGKFINPNNVDEESYNTVLGSLLGPVAKLFVEGPGIIDATLANPAARKGLQDAERDWVKKIDEYIGYVGNNAANRIQKNTGLRLLTSKDFPAIKKGVEYLRSDELQTVIWGQEPMKEPVPARFGR